MCFARFFTDLANVFPTFNIFKQHYYFIVLKRCLIKTLVIFSFQYLLIMNLSFTVPALPWYPPMGLAFVWFYLVGNQAIWGILLGGLAGYCLKGLPIEVVALYLSADILCGYWGAYLCQNSFASDLKIFQSIKEWLHFFKQVAWACLFSASLRTLAVLFKLEFSIPIQTLFFYYIDLWLADVNAILILSSFLFSWVFIPFSRQKIRFEAIVTALLFLISGFYLAYCSANQSVHLHHLGSIYYTVVPSILLLIIMLILRLNVYSNNKQPTIIRISSVNQ